MFEYSPDTGVAEISFADVRNPLVLTRWIDTMGLDPLFDHGQSVSTMLCISHLFSVSICLYLRVSIELVRNSRLRTLRWP